MLDGKGVYWFAMRVSYGRVLKFCAQLYEDGIEHFLPMCRKKVEKDGKIVSMTVPAVSNLCFIRSTRSFIKDYLNEMGENRYAHFMWDRSTGDPIIVADKVMSDFIQVCSFMSDDVLIIKDVSQKLREGQIVRITEGPFKGVEGRVVRIKKSRRVIVELPGMLAVTTNYIPLENLEVL